MKETMSEKSRSHPFINTPTINAWKKSVMLIATSLLLAGSLQAEGQALANIFPDIPGMIPSEEAALAYSPDTLYE